MNGGIGLDRNRQLVARRAPVDGLPTTSIAPIEIFTYAGVLWRLLQGEPAQPLFAVRAASNVPL